MKTKNQLIIIVIMVCMTVKTFAQVQTLVNVRPLVLPPNQLGWDNSGNPGSLEIRNDFVGAGNDINLFTGTTQKVTILNNGSVGIGTTYSPTYKFDVNGDINGGGTSSTTTHAYRLGTDRILWHNGDPSNILVGVGAGSASMTGIANTYVGNNAGNNTTSGTDNVVIGTDAGAAITGAGANVLVGYQAGNSLSGYSGNVFIGTSAGMLTDAPDNTFVGYQAGPSNTTGIHNSFFGDEAGENNDSGYQNTFIGAHCGAGNTSGYHNTVLGYAAGNTDDTGNDNLILGYAANESTTNLINASAIGAGTIVTTSYTMVLGNSDINVGIGFSNVATSPVAKLHVLRDLGATAPVTDPTAVIIENNDEDGSGSFGGNAYGIATATLGQNAINYGGFFRTETAAENISGRFEALGTNTGTSNVINNGIDIDVENADRNYGIRTILNNGGLNVGSFIQAQNARINYGTLVRVIADPTTVGNFGVIGLAYPWPTPGTNFNVGIYGGASSLPFPSPQPALATGSYAGYFSGDVAVTSNLWFPSDMNLKTDIQPLQDVASILDQINTYTYYFDTIQYKNTVNFSHALQYGFMAQEIEAAAPNLVVNSVLPPEIDSIGNIITPSQPVKMLNYIGMIPLLVQGYKDLKAANDSLIQQMAICCSSSQNRFGNNGSPSPTDKTTDGPNDFPLKQTIELASSEAILYQNQPNPFDRSTTIRYFIPENALQPKIIFQDETGKTINETELTEKGQGSIQINSSLLNSGIYTYSLQINGKIIDFKKMLKTK